MTFNCHLCQRMKTFKVFDDFKRHTISEHDRYVQDHPDYLSTPEEMKERAVYLFLDETLDGIRKESIFYDEKGVAHVRRQTLAAEILMCRKFSNLFPIDKLYYYDDDRGVWKPNGEQIVKSLVLKIIPDLSTQTIQNEVIAWIKSAVMEPAENFETSFKNGLVNLQNGVLDLETMKMLEHGPEHKFLWQLPVIYDPALSTPEAIKDIIFALLDWSYPDAKRFISLLEYLAYPLVNYNLKKAILLIGARDRGKSQYIHLFERIYGQDNIANKPLQALLGDPFALKALHGKLANIFADMPKNGLSNREAGFFKAITGGDVIGVRVMHSQDELKIINAPKLIFSANSTPEIGENADDDAYFSRWQLDFFENELPALLSEREFQNKTMDTKNINALFPWLLLISAQIRRQGHFTFEQDLSLTKTLYLSASAETMVKFAENRLIKDPNAKTDAKDIFDAAEKYCQENGLMQLSMQEIGRYIREKLGIEAERLTISKIRKTTYLGLRLLSQSQNISKNDENKRFDDESGSLLPRCHDVPKNIVADNDATRGTEKVKNDENKRFDDEKGLFLTTWGTYEEHLPRYHDNNRVGWKQMSTIIEEYVQSHQLGRMPGIVARPIPKSAENSIFEEVGDSL